MSNIMKTSMDSPLLNSALTNSCQEIPKEDENKSTACENSLQILDAMKEENTSYKVYHCGCSHTRQGGCSS
jgi:hypothetical protein